MDHATHSERFAAFAASFPGLPLYRRITSAIAEEPGGATAALLDHARPGQDRPVLLLAAVHDLVLRRPDLPLARWYTSVAGDRALDPAAHDPWPAFRQTCADHVEDIAHLVATRSTQTNEVNRCTLLAPGLAAARGDTVASPVALLELGPSAGLLLGVDRYRVAVGPHVFGPEDSTVRLAATLHGSGVPPSPPLPAIVDRAGLDLAPVSVEDADGIRWLEACLWPDQPVRVERFRAAVALARARPPRLVAGDLVDDLEGVAATLSPDAHLVVWHSWVLTYVARERRAGVAEVLGRLASSGRPVSWLTAEPPGCVPGIPAGLSDLPSEAATPDTVLGLRRWRDGAERDALRLAWSHPHGEWIRWRG